MMVSPTQLAPLTTMLHGSLAVFGFALKAPRIMWQLGFADDRGPLSVQRDRFINEHDWYVVPYFVHQAALMTNETIALLSEKEIPFALWTYKNIQQLLIDCHESSPEVK